MGVLGLTPFLQRHCPEVIKKLPDRLRSLRGKTVVIDGTLITQRLHFASIPWTNRHVLGWYKILQELKDSGVGVICVFDGQERNKAKARENARRQEVRKQAQARGSLEAERLKRLHSLVELVEHMRSSHPTDQKADKPMGNVVKEVSFGPDPAEYSDADLFPNDMEAFGIPYSPPDSDLRGILLSRIGRSIGASKAWLTERDSLNRTYDDVAELAVDDLVEERDHLDSESPVDLKEDLTFVVQADESATWESSQQEDEDMPLEYTLLATEVETKYPNTRLINNEHPADNVIRGTISDAPISTLPTTLDVTDMSLRITQPLLEAKAEDPIAKSDSVLTSDKPPTPGSLSSAELITEEALEALFSAASQVPASAPATRVDTSVLRGEAAVSLQPSELEADMSIKKMDGPSLVPANVSVAQEETAAPSPVPVLQPKMPFTASEDSPSMRTEDISAALAALYLEYCQSIPKIASLTPSFTPDSETAPALVQVPGEEISEDQSEYAMSRHQLQLTIDEGKVWDDLIDTGLGPQSAGDILSLRPISSSQPSMGLPEDMTQTNLVALAKKSAQISQSYEKRNHPPTADTYEESKEIIKALGIPCIDSVGAHEAEALAASLVLNGHADYVASEDTDVLVYEAPLIRGITSRVDPLVVVSGSEIRTVLDLDRAGFIDFALLLGTDFSQRIKNVGPTRALKFIRAHGSIEQILERERKYAPRLPEQAYLEQVEAARLVFMTLPPVPDLDVLQAGKYDKELVAHILHRHGLHRAVSYEWQPSTALDGNYFHDNPSAF